MNIRSDHLSFHALASINHAAAGRPALASFTLDYDTLGRVSALGGSQPGQPTAAHTAAYDAAGRLKDFVSQIGDGAAFDREYTYDAAGNRLTSREAPRLRTDTHNNLNQITATSRTGAVRVSAFAPGAAEATIDGDEAEPTRGGQITADLDLGPGIHEIELTAQSGAGQTASRSWLVDAGPPGPESFTYDTAGRLTSDGTRATTWDVKGWLKTLTLNGSGVFAAGMRDGRGQSASEPATPSRRTRGRAIRQARLFP